MFTFTRQLGLSVTLNDTAKTPLIVDAYTFGAGNVDLFVGSGPYFKDDLGNKNTFDTRNPNAVGLALENVNFGLSVMKSTTSTTKYIALKATADYVGLVGVDILKLSASGVSVEYNTVNNPDNANDKTVIDLSAYDSGAGYKVDTGNGELLFDYSKKLLRASIEIAELQIDDYVFVRGALSFEKGNTELVNLTGGGTANVSAINIGAEGLTMFFGVDGPYWTDDLDGDGQVSWALPDGTTLTNADLTPMPTVTIGGVQYGDLDGDGIVDANETAELNEDAVGLAISNTDFALALFKTEGGGTAKYTALKASADQVGFVGSDIFELGASRVVVELNISSGAATEDTVINFATSYTSELEALFNVLADGDSTISTLELDAAFTADYSTHAAINNAAELLELLDVYGTGADGVLSVQDEVISLLDVTYYAANKTAIDNVDKDKDSKYDPAGYEVSTGGETVYLTEEGRRIFASADNVLINVAEFVYVNGSIALDLGSKTTVTIQTGIPSIIGDNPIAEAALTALRDVLSNDLQGLLDDLKIQIKDEFEKAINAVKTEINNMVDSIVQAIVEQINSALETAKDNVSSLVGDQLNSLAGNLVGSLIDDLLNPILNLVPDGPIRGLVKQLLSPVKSLLTSAFEDLLAEALAGAVDRISNSVSDAIDNAAQSATDALNAKVREVIDPQISRVTAKLDQLFIKIDNLLAPIFTRLEKIAAIEIGDGFSTISGIEVDVTSIGVSNATAFVGIPPSSGFDFTQPLANQMSNVTGLLVDNLTLGLSIFKPTISKQLPTFIAAKISADDVIFQIGDSDTLSLTATDINVNLNLGGSLVKGAELILGTATIDFAKSFPVVTADDVANDSSLTIHDTVGFEVKTGTTATAESVYLDFNNGELISASVNNATLTLSEFVHVSGSFAFEKGTVETVNVTGGLVTGAAQGLLDDLNIDIPSDLPLDIIPATGATTADLAFMTIGAANVHAFVGLGGPYWVDGIVDGDINEDAIGLVINDFDFGLAIMTPTNPLDFVKYFSLKATAEEVSLVGIDDITLTAEKLTVEVNTSTPAVYGVPLFPVVDFATTYADDERQLLFDLIDALGVDDDKISVDELITAFGNDYGQTDALDTAEQLVDLLLVGQGPPPGEITLANVLGQLNDIFKEENEVDIRALDLDQNGLLDITESSNLFTTLTTAVSNTLLTSDDLNTIFATDFVADADYDLSNITTAQLLVDLLLAGQAPPNQVITLDEVLNQLTSNSKTLLESNLLAIDVDGDGKFDPIGYEINTGSDPVYLSMDSFLIKAEGRLELDLFSIVTLSGSVAFELGPTQDVILANGVTKENVTTLTIGGADISAFVGFGGPYWTDIDRNGDITWALPELIDSNSSDTIGADVIYLRDSTVSNDYIAYGDVNSNGKVDAGETADLSLQRWILPSITDGRIVYLSTTGIGTGTAYGDLNSDGVVDPNETAELDEDALGLAVTNLDFGILVMVDTSLSSPGAYAAGKIRIPDNGFSFVGVDGLTATGSLNIEFNLGLGAEGLTPVDFVESFPSELIALDTSGNSILDVTTDNLHADIAAADLVVNGGNADGIVTQDELLALYDTDFNGRLDTNTNNGIAGDALTPYLLTLDANDDGIVSLSGFEVNTGPGGEPVRLDFTNVLIRIQLGGVIELDDIFRLSGVFLFEVDNQGLKLFVNAGLSIGPSGDFFDLSALGVLIINSDGVAADFEVALEIGDDLSSGISNTGAAISARLIMNTTGKDQSVAIPDEFLDSLSPKVLARLQTPDGMGIDIGAGAENGNGIISEAELQAAKAKGELSYVVSAAAPSLSELFGQADASNEALSPPDFYIAVAFDAKLVIGGAFVLDGKFGLIVTANKFDLLIGAQLILGPLGEVGASGALRIDADGIVGRVQLKLDVGIGGDVGLNISGDALLEINTTSSTKTLQVFDFTPTGLQLKQVSIDSGILIRIEGNLNFVGFLDASASLTIKITNGSFYLGGVAHLSLGSLLSLDISLDVLVTDDGVTLDAAVTINASILDIIRIEAAGRLMINTSNSQVIIDVGDGVKTYAANSFLIDVNGKVSFFGVLKFNAGFKVQVGGGTFTHSGAGYKAAAPDAGDNNLAAGDWAVSFGANIDFFGIAKLGADGWFNNQGHFSLYLGGELVIGSRSTGIIGGFNIYASYTASGVAFGGGAHAKIVLFGWKLAGVSVSFSYDSSTGLIKIRGEIHLSFFFFDVNVGKTFTIGVFKVPPPVYLAGSSSVNKLEGGAVDADGKLILNMGDTRSQYRNLVNGEANETYIIRHVGGTKGDEEVEVTAFGRSQRFSGVSEIIANGGSGDDTIIIKEGVLSSVNLNGGSGDDLIIVGSASGNNNTVDGGTGDDVIEIGPAVTVPFLITGGPNSGSGTDNDYITAGLGDDIINAGFGNDTIYSRDGNDIIHAGAGDDIVYAGNGDDLIFGGSENDTLFGEQGNDWLYGEAHNDELTGGAGSDYIIGGTGDDNLIWDATGVLDAFVTGGDNSTISDGGNDTWEITATSAAEDITLQTTDGLTSISANQPKATSATTLNRIDTGVRVDIDSLTLITTDIESVEIDAGAGADTIIVNDFKGSLVNNITIDAGLADNAGAPIQPEATSDVLNFNLSGAAITTGELWTISLDNQSYTYIVQSSDTSLTDIANGLKGVIESRSGGAIHSVTVLGNEMNISRILADDVTLISNQLTVTSTSGLYRLTDGISFADIAWNADDATIQAALESFTSIDIGQVSVENKLITLTGATAVLSLATTHFNDADVRSVITVGAKERDAANDAVILHGGQNNVHGDHSLDNDVWYLSTANGEVFVNQVNAPTITLSNTYRDLTDRTPHVDSSGNPFFVADNLTILGHDGNDQINAIGMEENLIALHLKGEAANDQVFGSIYSDVIDGGSGDDRLRGSFGVDLFYDESGNDTLDEAFDSDMSLFGNTFIAGRIVADNEGTFSKQVASIEDQANIDAKTREAFITIRDGREEPATPVVTLTSPSTANSQSTQQDYASTTGFYQETDIHLIGDVVIGDVWELTITSLDINDNPYTKAYSYTVGANGDPATMVAIAKRLAEMVNADVQSALSAEDAGPEPIIFGLTDQGDHYADGAEVESLVDARLLVEIFENASLVGGNSNNTLVVNDTNNEVFVNAVPINALTDWRGTVTLDSLGSTGALNEYYLISLKGTGARYSINDTGGTSSYDELYVFGTDGVDLFTLDAAGAVGYVYSGSLTDSSFAYTTTVFSSVILGAISKDAIYTDVTITGPTSLVDNLQVYKEVTNSELVPVTFLDNSGTFKINADSIDGKVNADTTWTVVLDGISYSYTSIEGDTDASVAAQIKSLIKGDQIDGEQLTFQNVSRLTVRTLGESDTLVSKNTAVETIVELGSGNDNVTIGIVAQIPDRGNANFDNPKGIPIVDLHHLTNGVSAPAYIYGGTGDDYFQVDHNAAELFLFGQEDDDTFVINTFLVLSDDPEDPASITNLARLFGGTGENRYQYLQNAPVNIFGGPGIDTVVINGTAISDTFIITDKFVAGAGRIVPYTGIEKLEINGAGGGDNIYILSSPAHLSVTVRGGTGDDNIHLGGDHPTLFFDPPAFTYQPPQFSVQGDPVIVYDSLTWDPARYYRHLSWWGSESLWRFVHDVSNYGTVQNYVAGVVTNWINSWYSNNKASWRYVDVKYPGGLQGIIDSAVDSIRWSFSWGHWWFFDPYISFSFDVPEITVEYGIEVWPEQEL